MRSQDSIWLLALCIGCGPVVAEPPFDVAQVYTRLDGSSDGTALYTQNAGLRALELLPDGSVLTRDKGCLNGELHEETSHTWESQSASSVQLSPLDTAQSPTILELAPDVCGVHRRVREDEGDSEYVAGEYCRDELIDWGHGGYACTWAPCDDVAEDCSDDR